MRVVYSAILGAVIGGATLAIVASAGADPVVVVPVPQLSGGVKNEHINLSSVISKIAIVLGVCTGALVGARAGAIGSSSLDETPPTPANRPKTRSWP
jgi:hypothetical protein